MNIAAFFVSFLLAVLVSSLSASVVRAEQPAATPDFNRDVAPLFKKYCESCHNPTDREGKLVLADHAAVLQGGEHGPAVVPGKADESRLIQALTGKAEPAMPPEGSDKPEQDKNAEAVGPILTGMARPVHVLQTGFDVEDVVNMTAIAALDAQDA